VAHCLQCREKDKWSVSGCLQDEGTTVNSPEQLTVTMFSIIVTQPFELQIPNILVRHALGIEIEINLVELRFLFRIQFAIFEDSTLTVDPSAQ
jgi:hypothetical protein